MRLICTTHDPKKASTISLFLRRQKIENQIDTNIDTNWNSDDYGIPIFNIWVYEEDQFVKAAEWAEKILENPDDPQFQLPEARTETYLPPPFLKTKNIGLKFIKTDLAAKKIKSPINITFYIVLICIFLFVSASIDMSWVNKNSTVKTSLPIEFSPIYRELSYDDPRAFDLGALLISVYGIDKINDATSLPPEALKLLEQWNQTPVWHGLYDQAKEYLKGPKDSFILFNAPMFEKIQEGEFWRLVTPIFLHGSILHIVFNLILFALLGKKIEQRVGTIPYILFIIVTAIFSNTSQYLMSGAAFVGISGVICAMAAFIWVRQRRVPWEGYQVKKETLSSIAFFVVFVALAQTMFFFLEVYSGKQLYMIVANTGHLSGAFIGALLGYTKIFAIKNM